ncbi:hypothetical protein RRG08_052287 [Elysia crispata]|uniref:Uncharacterized protein n=1 Tax=Elysia crispata TaxID=231223 RepID=A0AAE1DQ54_9GAST|nr:hypothetical protein RRG08_052287 [Elysia crispata]
MGAGVTQGGTLVPSSVMSHSFGPNRITTNQLLFTLPEQFVKPGHVLSKLRPETTCTHLESRPMCAEKHDACSYF